MRKEPFIAGMTERGITVAPLSERCRFVKQVACVFNGSDAWSLSDSITPWSIPLDRLHGPPPGRHARLRSPFGS